MNHSFPNSHDRLEMILLPSIAYFGLLSIVKSFSHFTIVVPGELTVVVYSCVNANIVASDLLHVASDMAFPGGFIDLAHKSKRFLGLIAPSLIISFLATEIDQR